MLAGAAVVYAVGQEAPTEGAGDTYLSPALPTYQPAALFPLKETGETFSRVETQQVFLHDAIAFEPMWAAILDPGFQLPTPAPPPEPPVQAAGALSEAQLREVLSQAGWPVELHDQALAVACGIGNRSGFTSGESGCRPGAVGDGGASFGLFQIQASPWARYCGIPVEWLMDALENARCAWKIMEYDAARGYERWRQWSVKP